MNTDEYKVEVRLFLVDDQAIVGAAVKQMVSGDPDITFCYCQEPLLALQKAKEFCPTVILQDLVMPDISGMVLAKRYREDPKLKDVPLIVLSAKEEPQTKAEAFAAGANDYLVKLPDKVELLARVKYHSRAYLSLLQRNSAYEALSESQEKLAIELSQAADYVVSLFPAPVKEGAINIDWRFVPSERLGGDSLGYHWIDDAHIAFYLLDVCGHGVGSALLSITALNVIRSQTLPNTDFKKPEEVMNSLNETFQMEKHNGLFFTVWYGVYNCETKVLNYSSAGHPSGLLMAIENNAIKGVQELKTAGTIIGGLAHFNYTSNSITIKHPSLLYIFSDGVYEIIRPDNSMWTFAEFKKYIQTIAVTQPQEVGDNKKQSELDILYSYIQNMHGAPTLEDDFSILKIMFNKNNV